MKNKSSPFPAKLELAAHNLTLKREIPSASLGNLPTQTRLYCRIYINESIEGYGEAAPHPIYGPSIKQLESEIIRNFKNPGVKITSSAMALACWDAEARRENVPLWRYLEWPEPKPFYRTLLTFGGPDPENLCRQIDQEKPAGIKLKLIGSKKDVDLVREVSQAFPKIPMALDVNGGWAPEDAAKRTKLLESFVPDLLWIEQPCPSLDAPLPTALPVLADEAIDSKDFKLDCYDGIVAKPARMNLDAVAVLMRHASDQGKLVTLGCHLQSSVLTNASLSLGGFVTTNWVDLDSELLVGNNPFFAPAIEKDTGKIFTPGEAGLSTTPAVDLAWRRV